MALSTRIFVRAAIRHQLVNFSSTYRLLNSPSFVSEGTALAGSLIRLPVPNGITFTTRGFSTTNRALCEQGDDAENSNAKSKPPPKLKARHKPYTYHPVEVGMRYMESSAYAEVYGDNPVWLNYRRNFKGQYAPRRTRPHCITYMPDPYINTGSPCPICRDEYLVVHYENTKLLKQFISPHTGQILPMSRTGLCQRVQFKVELEIMKAYDIGLIEFDVPFRVFDYEIYYPQLKKKFEGNIV